MDSHFLAGAMINLVMICIGGFMIIRGKSLKANLGNQNTPISPNVLIILGMFLIIVNVIQILGIG